MIQENLNKEKAVGKRRNNFFERKRLINYDSENHNHSNQRVGTTTSEDIQIQGEDWNSSRKRFDELKINNRGPSVSPQPELILQDIKNNSSLSKAINQALPPLKNAR